MPSSSKQAELRRLMKLQREKQKQQELKEKETPKSILKVSKSKPAAKVKSGVSSLLAVYDDDDSSDGDDETQQQEQSSTRVSWPENHSELKRTRTIESVEPKRKRARFAVEATAHGKLMAPPLELSSLPATETEVDVKEKVADVRVKAVEEKPVDPETWEEFQALLDQADKPSADDKGANGNTTEERSEPANDETEDERVDTTEIEQVSYEARIAQLRLKAAARRKKKAPPVEASVTTYTPELAMRDEEEEDEKRPAPSDDVTPLEILRQKRRQKARMLARDEDS